MMLDKGFYGEDDVMKPNDTKVIYFPMKSPTSSIMRDAKSAIEQLEIWKLYQLYWCEHKPSITVYVKEEEWLQVGAWVYENFEDISFTEGGGLPGTDIGFWGGNVYPADQAMSGPNNVRMYGTWSMKNSATGKTAKTKHYAVLTFNEDGKVHTATEYASFDDVRNSFE